MRNKEELENQIKDKIKREYEDELKEKEYAKMMNEHLKKIDLIEKEKQEELHKQRLKEQDNRKKQMKDEFKKVVDLIFDVYKDFGIENYRCVLSLRDPEDKVKYHPDDAMWEKAETSLREVLNEM